jgi:hypothetical protein
MNSDTITCGACTVAIGAHTNDSNCWNGHHVFATCAFGFSRSPIIDGDIEAARRDAIMKLATRFRSDVQAVIRNTKKETGFGSMYFWTSVVHEPVDAEYRVEWFQPVGVEISDAQEHAVVGCTTKKTTFIPFVEAQSA